MDLKAKKDRIDNLIQQINEAAKQYYTLDKPLISDFEYDMLVKELEQLEHDFPELKRPDSPTLKVGGEILIGFDKVVHPVPMKSLNNVYSQDELFGFFAKINEKYPNTKFVSELKIDGLAINLDYENGYFKKASTRGDGQVGEDVTKTVIKTNSLPLKLTEPATLTVRGEIFMPNSQFKKINEERAKTGENLFANPRNATAGTIRQLNTEIVRKRGLDIFIYTLVDAEKYNVNSQIEALLYLEKLGFKVNPNYKTLTLNELTDSVIYYDNLRKNLDYATDGIVFKVNDFKVQASLGFTVKSPRWAIAYKFEPEKVETKINKIVYQVGRTGAVTPVAEFDRVFVSGTYVQRATLHNEAFVKEKDIRVGDYVLVYKAAEIIPEITEVIKEKRPTNAQPFEMIKVCPACSSKLIKKQAFWVCENLECDSRVINSLIHFCARTCMNIQDLGEKTIETLFNQGFIKNIQDIYALRNFRSQLIALEGFKDRSVDKILTEIEASKQAPFRTLLFALGIPNVGKKVASLITKHFKNLDALLSATEEEIAKINEIGPSIAGSLISYFNSQKGEALVEFLKTNGFVLTEEDLRVKDSYFSGKKVLITGTLQNYKRAELQDILAKLGANLVSSISKETDVLIVGENAGSKLSKAEQFNTTLVYEKDLEELLKWKAISLNT